MNEIKLEKYKTLSERYAKALLKSVQEKDAREKISSQLNDIVKIMSENSDIGAFFNSPIIKKFDKKDILEKSFKGKIEEKLYNFINILIDKNRMFILPNIEHTYRQELDKLDNIIEAEAQSVIKLDDDMIKQLSEKLAKITGKQIKLKNKINPDIIGGVILYYDGKTIDGSVKTRLKNIQKQLI